MSICHRDLKLENTLLTDGRAPRLKICDFGYSKSGLINSQPKSTVGTPAYIAPEVLRPQAAASGSTGVGGPNSGKRRNYDGNMADVWSCGVTLYVMLVGSYPFEDPRQPRNFKETIRRILALGGDAQRGRHLVLHRQDAADRFLEVARLARVLKGVRAHQHHVQRHAARPHVGHVPVVVAPLAGVRPAHTRAAARSRLRPQHLWRDVGRRAHCALGLAVDEPRLAVPEVTYLEARRAPVGEQRVLQLEVAVADAHGVAVMHARDELLEKVARLVLLEAPRVAHAREEPPPRRVLHHDRQVLRREAHLLECHDV